MTELEFHRTLSGVTLERIIYVLPSMTLAEAAERLDEGYGALVLTAPLRVVTADDVVDAIAHGAPLDASLAQCRLERPLVLPQWMPTEEAMHAMVNAPERCVIVADRTHDGIGRLTLPAVMRSLLTRPPWVDALRIALTPEETTLIEVEP